MLPRQRRFGLGSFEVTCVSMLGVPIEAALTGLLLPRGYPVAAGVAGHVAGGSALR